MITKEEIKYYTVKEFAAAAKITNKAVYQQLKTRLKEYSKEIDGIMMISQEALDKFYNGNLGSQVKLNQVDLKLEREYETQGFNKYISYLEQENKDLKEQLKDKDNTIKDLQQQVINLSNNISNISNDSLQQIASITKNIQLIQAAEVKGDIIKSQEQEIIEQPKKSFFDRLRGK